MSIHFLQKVTRTILRTITTLLVFGLAGVPASAGAQVEGTTPPKADPADVESVDAIIATLADEVPIVTTPSDVWLASAERTVDLTSGDVALQP